LQQYKLENQVLKDTASQDWFLYGGILSLVGVLLGFILLKTQLAQKAVGIHFKVQGSKGAGLRGNKPYSLRLHFYLHLLP